MLGWSQVLLCNSYFSSIYFTVHSRVHCSVIRCLHGARCFQYNYTTRGMYQTSQMLQKHMILFINLFTSYTLLNNAVLLIFRRISYVFCCILLVITWHNLSFSINYFVVIRFPNKTHLSGLRCFDCWVWDMKKIYSGMSAN